MQSSVKISQKQDLQILQCNLSLRQFHPILKINLTSACKWLENSWKKNKSKTSKPSFWKRLKTNELRKKDSLLRRNICSRSKWLENSKIRWNRWNRDSSLWSLMIEAMEYRLNRIALLWINWNNGGRFYELLTI